MDSTKYEMVDIAATSAAKPKETMIETNTKESFFSHSLWVEVAQKIVLILLALACWAIGYALFGEEVGVKSQMFCLAVLFITAKIAGCLVGLLKIPPLLGMLVMGVILRSVGFIELSGAYIKFAAILRQLALVNIMLPAGLGLNPEALNKMRCMILNLAVVPTAVEVIAMAVFTHVIMGTPWLWGILMGLLMCAVSPSVVIPCLFELQALGYGVDKGIHTLVIAASTIDDIVAIALFGINVGILFSTGNLTEQILQGPIGIAMGLGFGITWGVMSRYLPDQDDKYVVTLRTLLVGVGSVMASIGSEAIGYGGAGALGCITAAFVACQGWRKQGYNSTYNPVKQKFDLLWRFFEPISFGLIGLEINLSVLKGNTVLWGSICLLLALFLRLIVSGLVTIGTNFNKKEMFFIAVSWIPKATVQAALGPVALDYARSMGLDKEKEYANDVLIVAVMSIILTAPIGAFLIMFLGPRLLNQTPPDQLND